MKPERTIAIGDIHGCSQAFDAILDLIQPTHFDLLITLGDYVDRGPDSRAVLERMMKLQDQCQLIPLLGNHELMMLSSINDPFNSHFWLRCGGAETLESYGCELSDLPSDHLDFLRNCYTYYETDTHIFVHANYDPKTPMDKQPENVMFWEHLSRNVPAPHKSGKIVVVGHTPQPDGRILDLGHVVCLDTYCFGDGCLSAMDVQNEQVWQVDKQGQTWVASGS